MQNYPVLASCMTGSATCDKTQEQQTNLFTIKEKTVSARIYDVYINAPIDSADKYTELLCLFSYVGPQDVINVHLNTPGGSFWTALQIIQSMQSSAAKINTHAEGQIASAGTMILLSGDEIFIHPHSSLMFHNYSGGLFGKGHEIAAQAHFNLEYFNNFMQEIYFPFLDDEEITHLCDGKDFWMGSEEALDRLKRFAEYKVAQLEAASDESDDVETDSNDNIGEPEVPAVEVKKPAKKKRTPRTKTTEE